MRKQVSLREIFRVFLVIGATGFGGGMAIVSLTERVCVHEKEWLGHEEFMHGLAFGQLLGPFSLNVATFVGYFLRGVAGGIAAAVGFILPSFCLITLLSLFYFKYHKLPQLQSALNGTNPVIIALIVVAALGMAKKNVRDRNAWAMSVVAFFAAAYFKVSAPTVLVLALLWTLISGYVRREHV